ncbi:MAG: hypothetical protein D8M59_13550 [Planctomycetes bacterium]|nr:hypothetical protein [Planctomycetota bacterium]NOG53765.1 hypothetical protein [Planctomycetota bacterium]
MMRTTRNKPCISFTPIITVLASLLITAICGRAHGQLWYSHPHAVIELGDFGQRLGLAYAINDVGEITGCAWHEDGSWTAFFWRNGTIIDLGTLGGPTSVGNRINDLGEVTGNADTAVSGRHHAFYWDGSTMNDLGTLNEVSNGWGINNIDQIVGVTDRSEARPVGVLWQDGQLIELDTLYDGGSGYAYDINEQGQITGQADDGDWWRVVLWEDGTVQDLGFYGVGKSINEATQIVGQIGLDRNKAFLWDNGVKTNVHFIPYYDASAAEDINEQGEIVGWIGKNAITPNAFLRTGEGQSILLDDLVAPRSSWHLEVAYGINELGQITGWGKKPRDQPDFDNQAFLLTPVYPLFELSEAQPGVAGQTNTITASGIEPGTRVYFCWSQHGGGHLIPGCDTQVNALQIDNPKVAGTAIADGNGVATLEGKVPAKMSGQWLLFQAVVPNKCAISNLVVQKFE